jgi:Spy/CpxP family protein refolding chaperone
MKNKWIAAVAVFTLGTSLAVAAPHGGKPGKRGQHRAAFGAQFAEKLNLTDAQKEQIRSIHRETREQNAAFFQSARQTRQELREAKRANDTAKADSLEGTLQSQREQMKQIRAAERERVLAVLTPEQRAQLEQWKAECKAKRDRN